MPITNADIRATLLQVVAEQHQMRASSPLMGGMQQVSVLPEAVRRIGDRFTADEEQAILTAWYDLFRTGLLSWGYNLNNQEPPFFHVTEQDRRALAQISRDPSNPDGYIANLRARTKLNA